MPTRFICVLCPKYPGAQFEAVKFEWSVRYNTVRVGNRLSEPIFSMEGLFGRKAQFIASDIQN